MCDFLATADYRIMMFVGILIAAVRICLMVVAVKLLWKWLVPDLFPGLVAQGKIAGNLSYKTALKVVAVAAIFSFLYNPASFIGYTKNSKHAINAAPVPAAENKVRPKGMVISTASPNDQALISALRRYRPDIAESEIAIRSVGKDSADEVLAALEWAEANGIKVIEIDGAAVRSKDRRVSVKMKVMTSAGVYLSFLEFA